MEVSAVVQKHGLALQRRALWLTRRESDASDLFQDTVERALRKPAPAPEFNEQTVLRWVNTIMHNAFLDSCRTSVVRRSIPFDAKLEESLAPAEAAMPPPWSRITDRMLRRCIARLPYAMRTIVELQLQGLSYAQLAERLRVPTGTIGTRLLRARKRLRNLIGAAIGDLEIDLSKEIKPPPIRYRRVGQAGPGRASMGAARARQNRTALLGVSRIELPPGRKPTTPGKALPCH
jgi:RNA polymerase sigma-70 factor (ECF subfamily)